MKRITGMLVAVAVLLLPSTAVANGVDREDATEVFSRDVQVVVNGQLRDPNSTTPSDAQLFNVSGAAMGMTWGQWQGATATSRAVSIGGPLHPATDFHVSLDGLIPSGVYSIFYATFGPDSVNPLCPNAERILPVPSIFKNQQPDASSFIADEQGSADFHGRVEGHVLDAQQVLLSIIYHFDGHTYGELPNRGESVTQGPDCRSSFGEDAMRQLNVLRKW